MSSNYAYSDPFQALQVAVAAGIPIQTRPYGTNIPPIEVPRALIANGSWPPHCPCMYCPGDCWKHTIYPEAFGKYPAPQMRSEWVKSLAKLEEEQKKQDEEAAKNAKAEKKKGKKAGDAEKASSAAAVPWLKNKMILGAIGCAAILLAITIVSLHLFVFRPRWLKAHSSCIPYPYPSANSYPTDPQAPYQTAYIAKRVAQALGAYAQVPAGYPAQSVAASLPWCLPAAAKAGSLVMSPVAPAAAYAPTAALPQAYYPPPALS